VLECVYLLVDVNIFEGGLCILKGRSCVRVEKSGLARRFEAVFAMLSFV